MQWSWRSVAIRQLLYEVEKTNHLNLATRLISTGSQPSLGDSPNLTDCMVPDQFDHLNSKLSHTGDSLDLSTYSILEVIKGHPPPLTLLLR